MNERTAAPRSESFAAGGPPRTQLPDFTRRTLTAVGITMAAVLLALLVWYAADVFLLVFAAVLLAVVLRSLAEWVSRHTGLGVGWSLALVIVVLVGVLAAGAALFVSEAVAQFERFSDDLPRSVSALRDHLTRTEWGRYLISQAPPLGDWFTGGRGHFVGRVTGLFSTTFGVLGNLVVVLFIGLYLAIDPKLYVNGLLKLFPIPRRQRGREVLHSAGYVLAWWVLGRTVSMAFVGVASGVGLWAMGVDPFLVLALLAALLDLIPYVGPILGAVPAVLIGFMQGPDAGLAVLLLYVGIQVVENYVLTPLVQQGTVDLPPALTIGALALAGVLFGVLGFVLAAPMTAAGLVVVKMLYVEDGLGDRDVDVPGESQNGPPRRG